MASNKILIIGSGCALLPVIAECASRGLDVEVSKSPPIPEPLKVEFKASLINSREPYQYFIEPNPGRGNARRKARNVNPPTLTLNSPKMKNQNIPALKLKLIAALEIERSLFEKRGQSTKDHDLAIDYLKTGVYKASPDHYELLGGCVFDLQQMFCDYDVTEV